MRILLIVLLTLFVGGTYMVAGILKIAAPQQFLLDVIGFQLLPYPLAWITAFFLPWLELFCACALFVRRLHRGAAAWLALLSSAFILSLMVAEVRGLDLACGCFGDWLVFPNLATHLLYNSALVVASLVLLLEASVARKNTNPNPPTAQPR